MTALVIAEHDNQSIKGATLNTVTAALQCGGEVHVLVAGHNAGAAAQAASADCRRGQGAARRRRAASPHGLAENVAAQVLALAAELQPPPVPGHRLGQEHRAARGRHARRRPDLRRHQGRSAADTFERPIYAGNAIATVQSSDADQGDHRAHHRLRRRRRPAAAAPRSRRVAAVADSGLSQLRGQRDRQERPARADRGQDHRLAAAAPWAAARSSTRC